MFSVGQNQLQRKRPESGTCDYSEILTSIQSDGSFKETPSYSNKAWIQIAIIKEKTDLSLTLNLSAPLHKEHGLGRVFASCVSLNH